MIQMKGKFNYANIMIDEIDETTKEQIQTFLNHPAFGNTYIAIMPDCHAGKGAVIGFTMKMNDYIIPNVIGVDIGCGMLTSIFDIDYDKINLADLDNFIKENIPSGFNINKEKIIQYNPDIEDVCEVINLDFEKVLRSAGSLGGGNHFIEAGKNNSGKLCFTIHSGSRNFGKSIADFYQKKAKLELEKYFIRDQYKDSEFIPIESKNAEDYIYSMGIAQAFASLNRELMMTKLISFIKNQPIENIESIHNYIDFNKNIIRKGATPAYLGQKLIIPFNMRDGVAICEGLGNSKYNYSAPHGAGRILSRHQAKEKLNLDEFKNQMSGIYTTTANKETLDEAPGAYKDMQTIIDNISETVKIIDFIKPIYNFKAVE